MGFFRQDLEGTYISEMALKRRFLKGFAIFWEITLITLSKMSQNCKIRTYVMQNFMKLDMKNWVWGPKTNLGQFGSKAFGRGLIKPLVKNPGSSFHEQDLIFSRIMRLIQ